MSQYFYPLRLKKIQKQVLSFSILIILFCFSFIPLHAQGDLCANASTIACGATVTGTTSATGNDTAPDCGTSVTTTDGVWYTIQGTGDDMTADLCESAYDTELSIYSGDDCSTLLCVDGVDDNCSGTQSTVTWTSTAGTTYYIFVHGHDGEIGDYELTVSCVCVPPTAIYTVVEDCDNNRFFIDVSVSSLGFGTAVDITNNGAVAATTNVGTGTYNIGPFAQGVNVTITVDGSAYGGCSTNSAALTGCDNDFCTSAFSISCGQTITGTTSATGNDTAPDCGTDVTTTNGVWYKIEGNDANITADLCQSDFDTELSIYSGDCNNLVCIDGNDDGCGTQSTVTWASVSGTTYYVFVHGHTVNTGSYELTMVCDCNEPTATYTYVDNCSNNQFTIDVEITALGDATAVDITNNAAVPPTTNVGMGMYSIGPFNAGATVTITVDGTNYGGCGTSSAPIQGCFNATCAAALDLSENPLAGDNTQAISDAPNCGGNAVDNGLWYTFVGNGSNITITVEGTNGYANVQGAIYSGDCGALVCEDAFGGQGQTSASATITASVMGRNYFVIVDGYTGIHGTYNISADGVFVFPITLVDFSAHAQDEVNVIEWTTASEIQTEWMFVERSLDGKNSWKEIGKMAAKGSSHTTQSYILTDKQPLPLAYYRLVSMDTNGAEQISEVVEVERKGKDISIINVYPIPTQDMVYLQVMSPKAKQQKVVIANMLGRIVRQQVLSLQEGIQHYALDFSDLANGVYFVNVQINGQQIVRKVVKE